MAAVGPSETRPLKSSLEGEDDSGALRDPLPTVRAVRLLPEGLGAAFAEDAVLAGLGEHAARELLALDAEGDLALLNTLWRGKPCH